MSLLGSKVLRHRLAFPYILFGLHYFNHVGTYGVQMDGRPIVSFRGSPYPFNENPDEPFRLSLLPNTFGSLGMCFNKISEGGSLEEFISNFISDFWQTLFRLGNYSGGVSTIDLKNYEMRSMPKGFTSIDFWEEQTIKDPSFILDVDFPIATSWGSQHVKLSYKLPLSLNLIKSYWEK